MSDIINPIPDIPAKPVDANASTTPAEHARPEIVEGMTVAQYVDAAQKMHESQYEKKGPPKWLRWIGDGALSVFPINRFASSVGLTSGLFLGANIAKTLTGADFHHGTISINETPTLLQKFYKVVKYDPKAMDSKNRWIGYGMWGLFSAGGFVGLKIGTWFAYRDMYKKNKNPAYLEDYVARISQHQGDFWSWLSSLGGIFGTASGNFLTPIPGFNYGASLAFRATSMKDENLMFPGLGKVLSGSTTTLKYGVREGLERLSLYAVNNPSKNPTELELYAYTILGQVFGNQLKPEHIERFVDAVHAVRDKYWEEGGIPKDKKKAAMKEMQANFRGKGFEKVLDDIGLDPMTIDFLALKGMVGKMSNLVIKKAVLKEQEEFRAKLTARREKGALKKEEAAPEAAIMEMTPTKSFASPDLKKPLPDSMPRPVSHQERTANSGESAMLRV